MVYCSVSWSILQFLHLFYFLFLSLFSFFLLSNRVFSNLFHHVFSDLCKTKKCYYNAICIIGKDYKAYCQCPECPSKKGKPVCGSDGKTYPNECVMKRVSCMTATPITAVKQSKCGRSHLFKPIYDSFCITFQPVNDL